MKVTPLSVRGRARSNSNEWRCHGWPERQRPGAEGLCAAILGPDLQQWEAPGPYCLGLPSPAPDSASSFNQKADPHSWSVQGWGEPGQKLGVRVPASQENIVQALATSGNPPSPPSFPEAQKPSCGLAVVEKETPPKRETSRNFCK